MPRHDRERLVQERTSHVWDAVARGAPGTIDTLDPTLLETMRRLKTLAEQPRANADFADRLETELVKQFAASSFTDVTPAHSPARAPGSGITGHALPGLPTWQDGARHGRWPASLATAALVVLTLAGSLGTFTGLPRDETLLVHADREPASIPALGGVLESSLPSGVTAEPSLLQGTFNVIPPDAVWIDVERTLLDPGAIWSRGESQHDGEGPRLIRVESGALTIAAAGPIEVTRSGSRTPVPVDTGTDVVLHSGDTAFTPSGVSSHWRNDGATVTSILHAGMSTSELGTFPRGVHREQLIDQWATSPPPAPAVMTIRYLTLDPGASLSPAQLPGLQGLYVATGLLEAFVGDGQGRPGADFVLREGANHTVGGRGYKAIPAHWTLRNGSAAQVRLLIMVVGSTNPFATVP